MIILYSLNDCLFEHNYEVTSLATNGVRYLISGSKDCTVKVWIVESDKPTTLYRTLIGHSSIIQDVAITQDEKYVISGSWDGNVCIWDIESEYQNEEEEEPKFYKSYHEKGIFNTSCAFSTSEDINPILCTSGSDGKIFSCFDEFRNQNKLSNSDEFKETIRNDVNDDDNNNNNDKNVKIWKHDSDGIINYLLFSPANHFISSGCSEGIVCLWRYNDCNEFIKLNCNSPVNSFSYNPVMLLCATASDDNILIWDLEEKTILTTIVIDDFDSQPINNDENKDEIILKVKNLQRYKESYKSQLKYHQKNSDKPLIRSLSIVWFTYDIIFVACDDNTIRKYKINNIFQN
ncbi:hypothetical protein ACTFIW_002058 [Dictyostelium discoideum]